MGSRIKNDVKKLFEFWCEVKPIHGVDRRSRTGAAAQPGEIVESFPEGFRDKEVLNGIPSFAYPCELKSDSVLSYSFVHTTGDSKWRFGFCRHDPKTQTAMVLITYLPWHDTFLKLLPVLAELRRTDRAGFRTFLSEAYSQVPDLGGNLTVFYNGGQNHFIFERPLQFQLPSIPENHNLNLYYNFVDPKEMIAVFAAMLAERRIIFTSRHLDRLSSCIQAANAFLYPMVWQHIFIPVLPMELTDYLGAPMPYLIGVPKAVLEDASTDELGEVVILNCDTKIFESPFDDVHELPQDIVAQLKKYLSPQYDHLGDRVSKIFLGALVQLIGGYRDAVEFHDTGKTFNRAKFIESRPTNLRPFLAKMIELQIFAQFVDDRLKMLNSGLVYSDEFELETVRYAEKMKKRGRNYIFLKNVKDMTNPAVKSAVKSVKDSSRGMKTAYKDLKSKIRENTTNLGGTHFHFGLSSPQHMDRPDGTEIGYMRNGKATRTTHHSAPSSPVFSKQRTVTVTSDTAESLKGNAGSSKAIQQAPRRGPTPLAMSSSSNYIQSNGYAHASAAHYGQHLSASPAVSSASSLCSSDMNLSQELQNHPLFKTPIVDRTLKPNADQTVRQRLGITSSHATLPARPPPPTSYGQAAEQASHSTQLQTSAALHTPAPRLTDATTASAVALSHAHIHTPQYTHTSHNQRLLATTDSDFDSPPDMQSPPIPPRRQWNSNSVVAATAAAVSAGISRLERNCWLETGQADTEHHSDSLHSSNCSSCSSGASFVTAASTFSQLNISSLLGPEPAPAAAPIPAPRFKKEQTHSMRCLPSNNAINDANCKQQRDCGMTDLISLDDSNNTSYDLEDFDPLNKNARPMLPLSNTFNKKSTTLPASVSSSAMTTSTPNSINNPLYPYFAPKHKATVAAVTGRAPQLSASMATPTTQGTVDRAKPENDFELLRKYGLDQFSINATATTSTGTTTMAAIGAVTSMNKWTTFD